MAEPRNYEYLKTKCLVQRYFEKLENNEPTEEILFELKNYSIPLDEMLIIVENFYLGKIKEFKILHKDTLKELYYKIDEQSAALEKADTKLSKIEKIIENHPISKIIEIIK